MAPPTKLLLLPAIAPIITCPYDIFRPYESLITASNDAAVLISAFKKRINDESECFRHATVWCFDSVTDSYLLAYCDKNTNTY